MRLSMRAPVVRKRRCFVVPECQDKERPSLSAQALNAQPASPVSANEMRGMHVNDVLCSQSGPRLGFNENIPFETHWLWFSLQGPSSQNEAGSLLMIILQPPNGSIV